MHNPASLACTWRGTCPVPSICLSLPWSMTHLTSSGHTECPALALRAPAQGAECCRDSVGALSGCTGGRPALTSPCDPVATLLGNPLLCVPPCPPGPGLQEHMAPLLCAAPPKLRLGAQHAPLAPSPSRPPRPAPAPVSPTEEPAPPTAASTPSTSVSFPSTTEASIPSPGVSPAAPETAKAPGRRAGHKGRRRDSGVPMGPTGSPAVPSSRVPGHRGAP